MALRWKWEMETAGAVANVNKLTEATKANRGATLEASAALKVYAKASDGIFGGGAATKSSSGASSKAGGAAAPPKASKAPTFGKAPAPSGSLADMGKMAGASGIKIDYLAGGFQRLTVSANGASKSVIGVFDSASKQYSTASGLVGKIASEQAAASKKLDADRKATALAYVKTQKETRDKEVKASSARFAWLGMAGKAVAAAAAIGVAWTASAVATGVYLSKFALGYKGLWQLNALTARASWNFRTLFKGVDPSPVVRAWDRLTQAFNQKSFMGGAISAGLTKTFNGIFSLIEKAQPYVSAFGEGLVYGFLSGYLAILKVRLALKPYVPLIESLIGKQDGLTAAFNVGVGVFGAAAITIGLVGGAAIVAGGAIGLFAYNVGEVVKAFDSATSSVEGFLNLISKVEKLSPTGMIMQASAKAAGGVYDAKVGGAAPTADMSAAGDKSGTAYGSGVEGASCPRSPASPPRGSCSPWQASAGSTQAPRSRARQG